jgi:hypothetical protein
MLHKSRFLDQLLPSFLSHTLMLVLYIYINYRISLTLLWLSTLKLSRDKKQHYASLNPSLQVVKFDPPNPGVRSQLHRSAPQTIDRFDLSFLSQQRKNAKYHINQCEHLSPALQLISKTS